MKALLIGILICSSNWLAAQNVTGNWHGILTQPEDTTSYSNNYAFWLHIEQEGNEITGQSRVELGNSKNFAVLNFAGTFKGKVLDISEKSWEESYMQDDIFINWCQKRMNLIYKFQDSTETLSGIWVSAQEGCGPGEVLVHRSVDEFNARTSQNNKYLTFSHLKNKLKNGESVLYYRVILPEVTFETDRSNLIKKARPILKELRELMEEHPGLRIDIHGHTGNIGSDQYNLTLSRTRAKTVSDFLNKMGIPESRLQFTGYGESRPVATNTTEEGRKQNRRIEFEVIAE